jgi:hypothetical protein
MFASIAAAATVDAAPHHILNVLDTAAGRLPKDDDAF